MKRLDQNLLLTLITSVVYGYLGLTWMLTGHAPNRYVGGIALVFAAVAVWTDE